MGGVRTPRYPPRTENPGQINISIEGRLTAMIQEDVESDSSGCTDMEPLCDSSDVDDDKEQAYPTYSRYVFTRNLLWGGGPPNVEKSSQAEDKEAERSLNLESEGSTKQRKQVQFGIGKWFGDGSK